MTERLDPYELFAEDDVDLDFLLGVGNRRPELADTQGTEGNGEGR
jgi:hypothetical protein